MIRSSGRQKWGLVREDGKEHHLPTAWFRFYAELNHFLPPERKHVRFRHILKGRASVKDTIEALGIPHTEVDLILANGQSVDFTYILRDGDRVSVYPVFESIDITPLLRVRAQPLRRVRFVVDTHLGRLARYLRMLGFDTEYQNDYRDSELAELSSNERRILLTRDRGLLKRSRVTHGYCVRQTDPKDQLEEVMRRFDLRRDIRPFRRCIRCNGILAAVDKEEVGDQLPPRVREHFEVFRRCEGCGQLYWRGSHYERMQKLIGEILEGGLGGNPPPGSEGAP
jgi:uncharacterized protein with PIN domain